MSSGSDERVLFSVQDYEGVVVDCSLDVWESKIRRDHPEFEGREGDVRAAVVEPSIVLQDRDYPERRHHIRQLPSGLYLKVVTAYSYTGGTSEGVVITAFIQGRLRRGDTILYIRTGG